MKFLPSVLSLLASAGLALAATAASASASPSSPSNKNIKRAYSSTYADELTDGTACRDVTVLYARGTGQSGNIGAATDVGPEFLDALAALVGARGLAAQGVDYSASVEGFEEGGDPAGSALMAELAELAYTQCPDTLLVLSGYSQGGQLVHNAADVLSSEVTDFVAAVLIFGDPDNGDAVGDIADDKVHIICHALDGICLGTSIITPAHLNYQDDAEDAAAWVAEYLGY